MQTITTLVLLIASASYLLADHPIPTDSKSPWDFRGDQRSITNESYDALFACKTYEELIKKLDVAIEALETEADCAAPIYVASGCRLARIRAYYIIGETEKADALLERYAAVYRKQDGTPDFGEEPNAVYKDFNFDGHRDKMVFESRGGGAGAVNEQFKISLYDPKTKTYLFHEKLSQLCNPEPLPKTKQIHCGIKGAQRGGQSETYAWKDNDLILLERITFTDGGDSLTTVTERLVNGELKVVSREVEDNEGNPITVPHKQ